MDGSAASLGVVAEVATVVALVAAGLLVPAGLAKVRDPAATRRELGRAGPRVDPAVRALGVGELLIAGWVLLVGGVAAAAALGAVYLGFAAVAAGQRRRGAGCGCFGASDAPTGGLHVAVDLVAAGAALVAAVGGGAAPLVDLVPPSPLLAAASVVLLVTAVASVQLLLTRRSELRGAVALAGSSGGTT